MGGQNGNKSRERERDWSSGGNTRRINWEIENENLKNKVEQLFEIQTDIRQGGFLRDMWDY